MKENEKAGKWGFGRGGGGLLRTPVGCRGVASGGSLGAKPTEAENLFQIKDMKKTHFPDTLSSIKQPLKKYSLLCFKAFIQRNKPGFDKGFYPKTLYT